MLTKPMKNEIHLMFEMNKTRQIEAYNSCPASIKDEYYRQLLTVWAWQERVLAEVDALPEE